MATTTRTQVEGLIIDGQRVTASDSAPCTRDDGNLVLEQRHTHAS